MITVLSLFDGMSCGRIAFDKLGVSVKYYASEIDPHAIKVSKANYPDIVQLGDITNWREWDIDWSSIGIIIGGSPCQGFSFAGTQLAFDDPRSVLFFEYVDILNYVKSVNPCVKFLLENVKMKNEHLAVITEYLGVKPVFINSSLVSAQNRQRYYWCNWTVFQPSDKGIKLTDILETNPDAKWFHTGKALDYMDRSVKGGRTHWDFGHHADTNDDKSPCITANMYKGVPYNMLVVRPASMVGRRINPLTGKREDYNTNIKKIQTLEVMDSDKSRCVATSPLCKDTLLSPMTPGRHRDNLIYRKLTPTECERLQTIPDGYTDYVSDTQRYKMIGNGWTVDVIVHLLKCMIYEIK